MVRRIPTLFLLACATKAYGQELAAKGLVDKMVVEMFDQSLTRWSLHPSGLENTTFAIMGRASRPGLLDPRVYKGPSLSRPPLSRGQRVAAISREELSSMKMDDLQEILTKYGKNPTGRKTILVDKILKAQEGLSEADIKYPTPPVDPNAAFIPDPELDKKFQRLYLTPEQISSAENLQSTLAKFDAMKLLLSRTRIGPEGAKLLATVLPSLGESLEELDLGGNEIGEEGMIAIANVLPQCPKMKMITLWNNSITDKAVITLANAVPALPELRMLSLWNNQIGDEGAEALAQALLKSSKLKALDIGKNPIDYPGVGALERAVTSMRERDPKVLGLFGKKFGELFEDRSIQERREAGEMAR